jgi:iron complex outermembrane receptor protein
VHVFGDRYRYDGRYPLPDGLYQDYADGVWLGAESRVTRPIGERHSLIAGGEWRYNLRQAQGGQYAGEPVPDFTLNASSSVVAGYVQDEFTVTRHLTLNAGVRLDAYNNFHHAAPRLGVIVKPTQNEAFKYLYGHAFRAPNAYEVYYFTPEGAELAPETINTHEVVWERYTGKWLRTSVSGYLNRVQDLITLSAVTGSDFHFRNRDRVNGAGLGFEAEVRMASRVKLLANYVRQTATNPLTNEHLVNSPQNAGAMQLTTRGPWDLDLALDARATGARKALNDSVVPSFVVFDTTARRAIGKGLTLTAAARNLFDQRYADPGSEEHRQISIPQDGRTWRVGLEWAVGGR